MLINKNRSGKETREYKPGIKTHLINKGLINERFLIVERI